MLRCEYTFSTAGLIHYHFVFQLKKIVSGLPSEFKEIVDTLFTLWLFVYHFKTIGHSLLLETVPLYKCILYKKTTHSDPLDIMGS